MNERERTALAEAIEHCAMHNAEYQHVTPQEKIAEWQNVLGEAAGAGEPALCAARIAEALKGQPVLVEELRAVHGLRVAPYGAPMAVALADWPFAVDFARRMQSELDATLAAEQAELATLRRMREALVKLRDRVKVIDTEYARDLDEVLAMSAAPVEQQPPVRIPPGLEAGAALCERPFGCIACQGPPSELSEHRRRTIGALLTLIDAHAGSTKDGGAIEQVAQAIALLAGAPL